MKIVVVNDGLAYPPNAGNRIRTLNLLLPLARRHDITCLSRGIEDRGELERALEFYGDHGIRVLLTSDAAPRKAGIAFYARLARNLISPMPFSVAIHNSPLIRREIRRLVATGQVNVWQFETPLYADTLHGTTQRSVIIAHNVESLLWQRHYETARHPLVRFYIKQQWHKYERWSQPVAVTRQADSRACRRRATRRRTRHSAILEARCTDGSPVTNRRRISAQDPRGCCRRTSCCVNTCRE